MSYKPQELDTELNRLAWRDTLPKLTLNPRKLNAETYQKFGQFVQQKGLIKQPLPLAQYAVEVQF